MDQPKSHKLTLGLSLGIVVGMAGLAYASVPLYDLFCRVTGYGGTTQQVENFEGDILDRQVTVKFNADKGKGLPWSFKPVQKKVTANLGEEKLIFYRAENKSDKPITGTATFNVTPFKAGVYFNKIDCFCFTEQTLQPGEAIEMPVVFFVDPDMNDDERLNEIQTITLSYTFFPVEGNKAPSDEIAMANIDDIE